MRRVLRTGITKISSPNASDLDEQMMFAVTHAQEMLDCSVVVLSTSAELIAANNDIVHRLSDYMGEVQFPFRIAADLTKSQRNVDKVQRICRAK